MTACALNTAVIAGLSEVPCHALLRAACNLVVRERPPVSLVSPVKSLAALGFRTHHRQRSIMIIRSRLGASCLAVAAAIATVAVPTPASAATTQASCAAKPGTLASPLGAHRAVVMLDPGHSGHAISHVDPVIHLHDGDYPNIPELSEVWDVTLLVQSALTRDGYVVLRTKSRRDDSRYLAARAAAAVNAHADIAVSVHDDHGASASFQTVYPQFVGGYRGGGSSGPVTRFTNARTACLSLQYSTAISQKRSRTQQHAVAIARNNFAGRAPLAPGNLALVQLLAGSVPWVYNESGVHGNMTLTQKRTYALGIVLGIESVVPAHVPAQRAPTSSGGSSCQSPSRTSTG